jgi:type II secretory pathway pseudopilin PulG
MPGWLIAVIVVVVVLLLVVLVLLPKMREKRAEQARERELRTRRREVSQQHVTEADRRSREADLAEQKARLAAAEAERSRAEAEVHRRQADLTEQGLADDELLGNRGADDGLADSRGFRQDAYRDDADVNGDVSRDVTAEDGERTTYREWRSSDRLADTEERRPTDR